MKIAWLADFGSDEHPGGAQITNDIFIEKSPENFEIDTYYKKNFTDFSPGDYDLVVLNDVHHLPEDILSKIIDRGRYIKFEHAWQGVEELGNKFPELYKRSAGNIFLSPLARNFYRMNDILPEDSSKSVCANSPIEPFFQNIVPFEQRRPENICIYTGEIVKHKLARLLDWLDDNENFLVELYGFDTGYLSTIRKHPQCRYVGYCPHEVLPMVLNQYKYFVHFPRLEPFGRSTAEAYLCGCEIIANDRIGFLSYDWDFQDYQAVRKRLVEEAPQNFWSKVKEFM